MMGRRAGACGRRRGSQKTGLDARLKCGAVGGGAGWVPSPPPRESGQGGGSLCRMSLCCRRRGEETTEKCDGPTPDCDQPNTGGCGIVARSNSHNKLTAARRRRMIPYRQESSSHRRSSIPFSRKSLHLQTSSASQVGLTLLAESEPVPPASPTRARPHLHQG